MTRKAGQRRCGRARRCQDAFGLESDYYPDEITNPKVDDLEDEVNILLKGV
jgi:hypothetical protein